MRPELETYELIDRYLNEELRGEELLSFEKQMKEDASFAQEVEHQKLVNQVVIGSEMDMLREKIKGDIADIDRGKGNIIQQWFGGLLGLLIVGSVGYFFLNQEIKSEKKSIVAKTVLAKTEEKESMPLAAKQERIASIKKKKGEPKDIKKPLEEPKTEIKTPAEVSLEPSRETTIPSKQADTKENSISLNPFYSSPPEKDLKVNCDEVKIRANALIQGTCQGEQEGIITIYPDHIQGGTGPYLLSINKRDALTSQEVFSGLAAGQHVIVIKDKAGCISTQEIVIPEKDCPKMKRFVINPDLGEIWKLPVRDSESGTLTVASRSGMIVYKSAFGYHNNNEWNGTDMSGAVVGTGVYIYVIEYSNGKKENGQITINR